MDRLEAEFQAKWNAGYFDEPMTNGLDVASNEAEFHVTLDVVYNNPHEREIGLDASCTPGDVGMSLSFSEKYASALNEKSIDPVLFFEFPDMDKMACEPAMNELPIGPALFGEPSSVETAPFPNSTTWVPVLRALIAETPPPANPPPPPQPSEAFDLLEDAPQNQVNAAVSASSTQSPTRASSDLFPGHGSLPVTNSTFNHMFDFGLNLYASNVENLVVDFGTSSTSFQGSEKAWQRLKRPRSQLDEKKPLLDERR